MHRLLDFAHDDTNDIANRVAMQVHRAIDEHFPNVASSSSKFSKTAFSTSEDTHFNQTKASAEPAQSNKEVPQVKRAAAKQNTEQAFSDVKDLAPVTHQGVPEFSHVDTLSNPGPKMGLGKKVVLLLVVITLLSIGTAIFAYRLLLL